MHALACSLTLLCLLVSSQAQTSATCPAAPSTLKPTATNIFNAQQEQDLGDAYAEIADAHIRFVNDQAATAYLEKIGQRLLAVMPPNAFHFRYRIVDSTQVNAWSIAGGHIYFTRKLITAAANEDEIAGVMAHEFGHIFIHQQAIETTADLKYALNVTSVGDRADIFDKVQRLRDAENNWVWRHPGQRDQEFADAIAVWVLMKAGYVPGAYAEFWNQVTETKGKSGSVMGEIFHTTRPNEQLWTLHSLHAAPDLTTEPGSNEMVITFATLFEGAGAHELKAHPELAAEQKAVNVPTNGFLVEVLDKHTGGYLRGVVTDVPHNRRWQSTKPLRAVAFGDFALVQGLLDSTLVYRFSTGARIGQVFGEIMAQDAASGMFCVSNRDNNLVIYDAATLREPKHLTFATRVRFVQFLPARKELFVLTADQKVHAFSMDDLHLDTASSGTPGAGSR